MGHKLKKCITITLIAGAVVGTVIVLSWLYSWFPEVPMYFQLILAFTAISAIIITASTIKKIYDWVKAKLMQRNLERIKKEAESRAPKIWIHGVWGPYGDREKGTDCFELKKNSVEFLTINIDNKRDSGEVYFFNLRISFPEGFELLMEGDARLKRAKLGNTKKFINGLVGEGNPLGYRFLPKFGGDLSEPKDIQHNRRIFKQRGISLPIGPGSTFLSPFWVKTPNRKVREGKIHVIILTFLLISGSKDGARMKTVEHDIGIKIT